MLRRRAVWALVALLAVLHWDFWLWGDRSAWLGFLPAGLGYQVLISILASGAWLLAVRWAWPEELERWATEPVPPAADARDAGTGAG